MSTAAPGRLASLLRWLGITLVVLFVLQGLALLASWNWSLEPFRQVLVERLVGEAPMALVGLLLMLFGTRLDQQGPDRTPLRWFTGVLAVLLALVMVVMVPVSIDSSRSLAQQLSQAEAAMAQQAAQLEMQRKQVQDPAFVDRLIAEAERDGRIPAGASSALKQQKARDFIDTQVKPQLDRMEQQLGQARLGRDLAVQQQRFTGTGRSVVLAIAFALVALVALL
ncbi:MAG: HpsJ family protein [Synechococcaceae cyanobacterium]|nr:HpsJ family protein [Synechococcaceae cyanobacterium]